MGLTRKSAFTLAEVLITLGIIGIVAAMTLPALIQSHREKQTVSQLKKFYSVMSNAFLLAYNEHGALDDWGISNNDNTDAEAANGFKNTFIKYIKPYLKVTKFCEFGDASCEKSPYSIYSLDGTAHIVEYAKFLPHLVLADGSSIIHLWFTGTNYNTKYGEIYVDLNGLKNPNKLGEDIFVFGLTGTKIYPYGIPDAPVNFSFDTMCSLKNKDRKNGYGCAGWVIYQENMDYLRCNDLSWNGKKKCN